MDITSLFQTGEKREEDSCAKMGKMLAVRIVLRCGSRLYLPTERKFTPLPLKVGMADGCFQKKLGTKEQKKV